MITHRWNEREASGSTWVATICASNRTSGGNSLAGQIVHKSAASSIFFTAQIDSLAHSDITSIIPVQLLMSASVPKCFT